MNLHRLATCLLGAFAVAALVHGLSRITVPPAPRLGRRGAERKKALEAGGLFPIVEPLVRYVAGIVALARVPGLNKRLEIELRRAGYCLGMTADEYCALCLLSSAFLGGTICGLSLAAGSTPGAAVPAGLFGLALPRIQIREIARNRAKQITRGLPHAIQVAAMCMGAGLDFPGSLRQLAVRSRTGSTDVLADEFAAILEELDLGHTRGEALRNFADRVPTESVRDFVNAIVQAEQKGNPLARVLGVQGRMLTMRRSVAAEEAAARAGVLMIVPMILLVSCILLLLMGPFFVRGIGM